MTAQAVHLVTEGLLRDFHGLRPVHFGHRSQKSQQHHPAMMRIPFWSAMSKKLIF